MFLKRFNTGAAVRVGSVLAEELVSARPGQTRAKTDEVQRFLQRVDQEARPLKLGWFGRARMANAFKWRLREAGFAQDTVDDLTHTLLLHLLRPSAAASEQVPMRPNRAMRRRMAKKR